MRTHLRLLAILALLATSTGSSALGGSSAEYTLTFEATWSAATHPEDFPPNPHFSGLIGGTHNDQVSFWSVGVLASPGVKSVAETGSKTLFQGEVQAAIDTGEAEAIISGGGIPISPGAVSTVFTVSESYPLVTVISMLAPSPDWFVGVTGLSLRQNDSWLNQVVIPLGVFDSGTDSGTSYQSPNQPTVPPVPVFEKIDGPFQENNVVGTFTFTRVATSVEDELAAPRSRVLLRSVGPNPIFESGRFEIDAAAGSRLQLAVFDVRGRHVRQLLDGTFASTVSWDGRDDRGVEVAAGVYFVRLLTENTSAVQKVTVAR